MIPEARGFRGRVRIAFLSSPASLVQPRTGPLPLAADRLDGAQPVLALGDVRRLQEAAVAVEVLAGRDFATPADVKAAAPAVMARRWLTRARGMEAARQVVSGLLASVRV
jgi:hypothetical protein